MDKITVYTLPACVQCSMTYRRLNALKVDFASADLSAPEHEKAAERFKAQNLLQAPIVEVVRADGTTDAWSGFRPDLLDGLSA